MEFPIRFDGSILDAEAYVQNFFRILNLQLAAHPYARKPGEIVRDSEVSEKPPISAQVPYNHIELKQLPPQGSMGRLRISGYRKTAADVTGVFEIAVLTITRRTRSDTSLDFSEIDATEARHFQPILRLFTEQLLIDDRINLHQQQKRAFARRVELSGMANNRGVIDSSLRELSQKFGVSVNTISSDLTKANLRTGYQQPRD